MRNVSQLHPTLQKKVVKLQQECKKQGIKIKIGECVRTVAEQNALYAKGRNGVPGPIVTKAKGTDYRSMHQWGVAFDFFLDMDVDKDGKKSDDVFNNATKLFNKVGAIGKKLGLEWGGDWKSIKDLPHFQLPDWGSTATQLKKKYGTPEIIAPLATTLQSTLSIIVAAPIIPIAVCAIVLMALTAAAFTHSTVFTFGLNTLFFILSFPP